MSSQAYSEHSTVNQHSDVPINSVLNSLTAQKQAEEALRAAHERLALLTAAVPGVLYQFMVTATGEWKFIYLSKGIEQLYEVTSAEALNDQRALTGCILPEDQISHRESVENAVRSLSSWAHEHRIRTRSGNLKWVRAQALPQRQADGSVLWNGILIDITERKQAEDALHTSETSLKAIFENSLQAFLLINSNRTVQSFNRIANENAKALFGKTLMAGDSIDDYVLPQDRTSFDQHFTQALAGEWIRVEKRFSLENSSKWFEFHYAPVHTDGNVTGVFVSVLNITDRKLAEEALRESEQRYRLLADYANDVIWTMTLDGRLTYVSPAIFQLRGFTPEEARQESLEQAVCANSRAVILGEFRRLLAEAKPSAPQSVRYVEVEQPCKDGTTVWVEITGRLMYDAAGQPNCLVGVSRDITERKRLKDKLQQQAITDELTGIFNRRHFIELAHRELKRAIRLNHALAIAVIDIDRFKEINDTYGHAAGDQALVSFSNICQRNLRAIDVLARFGGDEFALLLPEADREQACTTTERLRLALTVTPIDLAGQLVSITLSCGVATLMSAEETVETLLSHADCALYRAKAAGRNRIVIYGNSL